MRNLLLFLVSVTITILSSGQEKSPFLSKLTLKFQTGAGTFTPGSFRVRARNTAGITGANYSFFDTTIQAQSKKGIGRTIRFGAGINYNLNDFLILGLDFETHLKFEDHIRINNVLNAYAFDSTFDEIHYKVFTFSPYISFKALAKRNFFIYNKLGVLFTLPFTLHRSSTSHSSQPTLWPPMSGDSAASSLYLYSNEEDDHQKIKFQTGFNVALGINFRITNHWRFYAEVFGNFSPLVATSSEFNSISTSTWKSYVPTEDQSVDPPLVYYAPQEYGVSLYSTTHTKYQTRGPTTNSRDSAVAVPGTQYFRWFYSSKTRSSTYNMNAIGINLGVIWRPRL